MSNRQLLDRAQIDKIFLHTKSTDEMIGTYEKICDLESVTEKEIVQTYLEKLKEKIGAIEGLAGDDSFWKGINASLTVIDNFIEELDN